MLRSSCLTTAGQTCEPTSKLKFQTQVSRQLLWVSSKHYLQPSPLASTCTLHGLQKATLQGLLHLSLWLKFFWLRNCLAHSSLGLAFAHSTSMQGTITTSAPPSSPSLPSPPAPLSQLTLIFTVKSGCQGHHYLNTTINY